ncbi:hypothetical protein HUN03_00012 [Mycoplasmopsis anatis]|uniref:type III toxin-antitoxin system ToxN/AbiQ family toxin n=1 Tax=Mycoplasmopsis anatis TaxID=171279 RepID=UPI001C4E1B0D|nr:type III toxin-antitoxin system ToxN/AbiQ family toxin [Mycoplasmopsis anatis]MBW0595445.1 hypothetical protein [Mycoplasmopsis anatis]MBW0598892.1 hypothetical protein [Mycoplasmopsis anatis]MBW0602032.1 hypothetical protein [Mycoplasmopsis anatis]MBW0603413.1 hypothetical protein [Mycoplasmopsis anatis]
MNENIVNFIDRLGFYTVEPSYLEHLHLQDREVQYNPEYRTKVKPHLGIVVNCNDQMFLVPLSSPKEKFNSIRNNLYEYHKIFSKEQKLIGILMIKKMIPVTFNLISKIQFEKENKYHHLLTEQLQIINKQKSEITKKITTFYKNKLNNKFVYGSTNLILDLKILRKIEKSCDHYRMTVFIYWVF